MSEPAAKPQIVSAKLLWQPRTPQNSLLAEFMRHVTEPEDPSVSEHWFTWLVAGVAPFVKFPVKKPSQRAFLDFGALHDWSVKRPEKFWSAVWDFSGIIGDKGKIVIKKTDTVPWARFFPDAKISYAENLLAAAATKPGDPAIIFRLQNEPDLVLTWQGLCNEVSRWQQALSAAGLRENDRVAVYLPNVPEAVIILLAVSNIGAVFASAGMEMGPSDLINRFAQVKPKILITADGYLHGEKEISRLDVIKRVQDEVPGIEKIVVLPLLEDDPDLGALKNASSEAHFLDHIEPKKLEFKRRSFNHPLYILFSSGSTGKPKCFEHSTGGVLLKHAGEHLLQCDIRPGDRVFYHATPSWMMWNWLVGALAAKATILVYDGSPAYPDANAQWDFTAANGCTHHGTAAPVILSWQAAGINPSRRHDLSALRVVMSTGAVLPAQGFEFIHRHVKNDVKISSISGGTDIVGCFLGGNAFMPTYAGQINGPMLGMDVRVMDENAQELEAGQAGELVCAAPFPSMPLRFLDDPDGARYREAYFDFFGADKKLWRHGDTIEITPERQYAIVGRSDATLNQNGVRIGTGAIYDQLTSFRDRIKEAAAVDFTRPDNAQAITILFLALENAEKEVPDDLAKAIRAAIKTNVGPYSVPTEIIAVPGVLKTPNGKIAEVVMKKALAGKDIPNASLYGEALVKNFTETGAALTKKYS